MVRSTDNTLVAFTILFVMTCVSAMSRDSTDFTYITPANYRYLWYGQFQNHLDSCVVQYQIGEFRVHATPNSSERILMQLTEEQWRNAHCPIVVTGSASRGRDE